MTDNRIAVVAERLLKLADDYKSSRAALLDEARKADIDPAALGRLVTWMRKPELARLDEQAVDEQFRFHAGLRPTAAESSWRPIGNGGLAVCQRHEGPAL